MRHKVTHQALRTAKASRENLAKGAAGARAIADMQIAEQQTQLEEDQMRMAVLKEILQTLPELFPINTACTDDRLWEMLRGIGSFTVCQCYSKNSVGSISGVTELRKRAMGEFSDKVGTDGAAPCTQLQQ